MIKAGRHLLELINEVLDLSRIESGRLSISAEPVQADEIVHESVSLIRPVAAERGITISQELVDCDVFVRADRQRSKQVLLNLLSNAVKYNKENGHISISGRRSDDRLLITIADTGPGIPEAFIDKLFEPFERLGAERLGIEGTGLGLALSKQLVELMEGELVAVNRPGEGASFTIELPIVDPPEARLSIIEPDRVLVSPEATKTHTLLLIEDNLSNIHLIERILKQRPSIGLISAMQGGIGLELAREHQPDVILLDLHLPDLSGADVLNHLRADPETKFLPVVVASAEASPGQVTRLLEAGAVAYLTKPLDLGSFLSTIDGILAGSKDEPHSGTGS
jgi:CheY-like chemotaxis protein/two-component sensor histidine kinase